jgi:hypothetical protein
MKLTEEEKQREEIVERQQYAQLQVQAAFALCESDPNFLNNLHRWHIHAIIGNILLQRNFSMLPISVDEIRNSQRRMPESALRRVQEDPNGIMLAELFKLQCVITECQLANPGCSINVSFTRTGGQLNVSVTATGPRSLQNS